MISLRPVMIDQDVLGDHFGYAPQRQYLCRKDGVVFISTLTVQRDGSLSVCNGAEAIDVTRLEEIYWISIVDGFPVQGIPVDVLALGKQSSLKSASLAEE